MNFLISVMFPMHFCNSFEQIGNESFVKIVYGFGRVQGYHRRTISGFPKNLSVNSS